MDTNDSQSVLDMVDLYKIYTGKDGLYLKKIVLVKITFWFFHWTILFKYIQIKFAYT